MSASRPPLLDALRERARQGGPRQGGARIVLPEAQDLRVLRAAAIAWREGLCVPILVGDAEQVRRRADGAGVDLPAAIEIADPALDARLPALAEALEVSLTARKLRVLDLAVKVRDPLYYADLLVLDGRADGAVMGALATTSDTLRAALRVIGVDPEYRHVTSCFLMVLPDGRALIYADCGVIPQPNAEQLADIARQAAATYRLLVGGEPKVALLAFSTKGSANHPALEPIRAALELLRARGVDFAVDGELQADAALVPEIGRSKAPGSPVAGAANVLVFPDLNSGNIAYKLTERLAQASAIGPLLRGLARPIHDLSRGCSVDDIVDTVAITALDAARHASSRRTP
jgi:phosphate acetyltransferase